MNLLMLTKFYPYGTGEAFIENEINIFSKYYENILIIACEVPEGEKRIRKIPSNVKACRIDATNKIKKLVNGCLKYGLKKDNTIKEELNFCKGFKRKAFLYYFEEKSQGVYKEILKNDYLKEITNKPFMLYSYWLFMTARVGTLITAQYKPVYKFTRAHRYDLYEERNDLNYLPFRRMLLNEYNNIFPCSENGTDYLKRKYPQFSEKIKTAFLGTLDYGLGKSSDDGVFRLVSCSRIVKEKRVDRIVNALKILDSKNKKIEWHHIGDGDGLTKIKGSCSNFTNIKCVFHGNIPNKEVLKQYKSMPFDLFLNVSSSEGLPVSIMEAMSFGMPVVATNVGGTNEIVFNGLTGTLLEEDFTDETLANAIYDFICMMSNAYKLYRDECRSVWEKHFQAVQNYTKLCDYLNAVCQFKGNNN